ncbi:hypothetical protein WJ58_27885 [Burkholderia ubonensis]|nr:hypothetical protein WJ58_27885 [Burkholderia ubonensis]
MLQRNQPVGQRAAPFAVGRCAQDAGQLRLQRGRRRLREIRQVLQRVRPFAGAHAAEQLKRGGFVELRRKVERLDLPVQPAQAFGARIVVGMARTLGVAQRGPDRAERMRVETGRIERRADEAQMVRRAGESCDELLDDGRAGGGVHMTYGTRTPGSSAGKSFVLRETSSSPLTCALAQTIASGRRIRLVLRIATALSAMVESRSTTSNVASHARMGASSAGVVPTSTSIQVIVLIAGAGYRESSVFAASTPFR